MPKRRALFHVRAANVPDKLVLPDMEIAPNSLPPRRSVLRQILDVVFNRKVGFVAAALMTVVALIYAEENFRGSRAWERYRKSAESRGVKLDFVAHVPPTIPDAENAALTPWIQSWFPKPPKDDPMWPDLKSRAENLVGSRKPDGRRHLTDLVAWSEALQIAATNSTKKSASAKSAERIRSADREPVERAAAAVTVLDALKIYQPALEELRAASTKSRARYPVDYKLDEPFSILIPHLRKIKEIVSLLGLRSSADLATDKSEEAFKDVQLSLWLTESLRDEPFILNQLVRAAALQINAQTIWEGIAEHKWNDVQLQALQARLSQFDFLTNIQKSLDAERSAGITAIEYARKKGDWSMFANPESESLAADPTVARIGVWLMPRGWFRMEAANYAQVFEQQQNGVLDLQKRTVDANRMEANNTDVEELLGNKKSSVFNTEHRYFARLLLPALKNATRRYAAAQVAADEAALACAIERYRLANGTLPETLDALAPKFIANLPHDTLTGGPFKYERVGETDFVISSQGWPDTEAADGKPRKATGRDWIWRSGR
jgi:hypothetical protein